jgi:hypothetical protein
LLPHPAVQNDANEYVIQMVNLCTDLPDSL